MKQCMVTILSHNNTLTGGMCLLGFRWVYSLCALSFILSSIRLVVFFFKYRNHTETLIFRINTFLYTPQKHFRKCLCCWKSEALIISSVARETLRLLSCHFDFCQHLDCNQRRDLLLNRWTDTRQFVPLNTLTQPLSARRWDQSGEW